MRLTNKKKVPPRLDDNNYIHAKDLLFTYFEIHDLQSFLSKNALVKISFFTRIPNLMSGTLSANKGVKTSFCFRLVIKRVFLGRGNTLNLQICIRVLQV